MNPLKNKVFVYDKLYIYTYSSMNSSFLFVVWMYTDIIYACVLLASTTMNSFIFN